MIGYCSLSEALEMIETRHETLLTLLKKGIERAKATSTCHLVSYTKIIGQQDPVFLFEQAKVLNENRTFWKSATEDFYIVSIGNVSVIRADDQFRYEKTYKKWMQLKQKAFIHNPYQTAGTGLLMFGGMSFDPKRERTSLWRKYPHSVFVIPKFTFTKNNDKYYLTTTIKVTKEDIAEEIAHKLTIDEKDLLTPCSKLPKGSKLISKREIEPIVWKASVERAINEIKAGKAEKIVMARELRVKLNKRAEITVVIERLLRSQPNCYIFAIERGEDCFLGATPERLVKVNQRELLSTCLASQL